MGSVFQVERIAKYVSVYIHICAFINLSYSAAYFGQLSKIFLPLLCKDVKHFGLRNLMIISNFTD
jgi:hypothetical protein